MSRPCRCRRIRCKPDTNYFKPRGIPLDMLEEVNLTLDELEAVRLADFDGFYQENSEDCVLRCADCLERADFLVALKHGCEHRVGDGDAAHYKGN